MNLKLRSVLPPLFLAAAGSASAGVITQDGVVFTASYTGNVLTLEIDAAGRTGGWAGATAIDALAIKTVGNFSNVRMTSPTGASWTNSGSELKAAGCGAVKGKASAGNERLCYTGGAIGLTDNMLFTFTFDGSPTLGAPHLKVHFVDAKGGKVGSLLSMDFPWQAETTPAVPASGAQQGGGAGTGGSGSSTTPGGSGGAQPGNPAGGTTVPVSDTTLPVGVDPALIPVPGVPGTGNTAGQGAGTSTPPDTDDESTEVPEPQSLAIFGAGLAVMGVSYRQRRQRRRAGRQPA